MLRAARRCLPHYRQILRALPAAPWIGPDETGTLVEVGVIEWHGVIAIAHAMRPARTKYLR